MKWPFWNIIPGAASIPKDLPTWGVLIPALTASPEVITASLVRVPVVVPLKYLCLLITRFSPAWNWVANEVVFK